MARCLLRALFLTCLIAGACAVPVKVGAKAKAVAKGQAKVAAKKKVVPRADPCQIAYTKCDLRYGPVVPKFTIGPVTANTFLTTTNLRTKEGKIINTASVYGCSIYGNAITPCSNLVFLPRQVPNYTGSADFKNPLNYRYLGVKPLDVYAARDIKGKCIVVRVNDFDVSGEGFVNQGDNNPKYPAARRCVVIKTV